MIELHMSKKTGNLIRRKTIAEFTQQVVEELFPKDPADLTILIRDDAYITEINKKYLGNDRPTDVLSFPANEMDPETGRIYLGDIILSIDTLEKQASKAGHPILSEAQLLIIHALLHIKGFDHDNPEQKTEMWAEQERLIKQFNVQIKSLPETDLP